MNHPLSKHSALVLMVVQLWLWSTAAGTGSAAVSAVDFRGREVTLPKPAQRIVCLIESGLSGLYMLGAQEQIVGISANIYNTGVYRWYAMLDDRIREKQLPAPGNWDFVNLESVLVLKPDLVLIWSEQKETITALEERNIPVFGIFLQNFEDVYREMEALGILTGHETRAKELVQYTRRELDRFTSKKQAGEKTTSIYYMWAQGKLETSCGGSTVNDLVALAGARNVCADQAREHAVVNLESVLSWNPEVIIMWRNERLSPEDIVNDPQWRSISAVRSHRVYEFPEIFLCDLWTLKFQHAVKLVAKWAYPAMYNDIDLVQESASMLQFLYGKPFQEQ